MSSLWPISSASRTDVGCCRDRNEDYVIDWRLKSRSTEAPHDGVILAVADGVGGHNHGDVASRMVCELLANHIRGLGGRPQTTSTFCASMAMIFQEINDEIIDQGEKNPAYEGMGTTLTSLVLFAKYALVAHIGDSRLYRLRSGQLLRLSPDHTMVQSMLDKGILDTAQAQVHPYRHILTAAIGRDKVLADTYTQIEEFSPGDRYLLCTDGLYDVLPDDKISEILDYSTSPAVACDRLVNECLAEQVEDNISVVTAFVGC